MDPEAWLEAQPDINTDLDFDLGDEEDEGGGAGDEAGGGLPWASAGGLSTPGQRHALATATVAACGFVSRTRKQRVVLPNFRETARPL